MKIFGHRGASGDFPENTLEAFRGAVAQGADGVELDVMQCATGELVVCHDEWLDRLAGQNRELARLSLRELKSLDVGTRLGFARAEIPTLAEVFDALPPGFTVNVEIKCDTVDDHGLSVKVGAFVEREGLADRVFLSSFNPLCLVRLARTYPSLKRGLLIDPEKSFAMQGYGWLFFTAKTSVHPHFSQCTESRVSQWHDLGLEVAAWTVDDPIEAKRLQSLGVEYVITNRPGALRAVL